MQHSLRLTDVCWLSRIVGVLVAKEVVGRRVPLPRLARLLEGKPRPGRGPYGPADAERLVWLTQGLLLRLYRHDFCYPRSLVLFHFLSRWGYRVHLNFGIRREGDMLAGHAWLDLDGRPFAEPEDPSERYRITYTYPSSTP